MIWAVVDFYKWTPHYAETLYLDDMDHLGIWFWYKEVDAAKKKMKG